MIIGFIGFLVHDTVSYTLIVHQVDNIGERSRKLLGKRLRRGGNVDILVTPDGLVRLVLEQFFGRASIVVFMWVLFTAAFAWIGVGKKAVQGRVLIKRFFSFLSDDFGRRSGKVRSTLQLAGTWAVFYGIASFVTQLWAGSDFSKGQGDGLTELISWSVLFGVFTLTFALLLLPSDYEGSSIFISLYVGYGVGLVYATIDFTLNGPPRPGDWWVAPAASCCLVLVAASAARMKRLAIP